MLLTDDVNDVSVATSETEELARTSVETMRAKLGNSVGSEIITLGSSDGKVRAKLGNSVDKVRTTLGSESAKDVRLADDKEDNVEISLDEVLLNRTEEDDKTLELVVERRAELPGNS